MNELSGKNWLEAMEKEFDHPAIVLWRAVELRHIEPELKGLSEPILDLGCAEGKIAEALFKGDRLFGLDNCWELLRKNKKSEIYAALTLGDGCCLPYKDAVFESVFSNCVIEHIPNIESLLSEVSRVLKVKGVFLFTVPSDKFADFLFFSTIFEKIGLKSLSGWYKRKRNRQLNHFHCYSHNRWEEMLKGKGLKLVRYRYYMPREATFYWDFLAALMLVMRSIWPLTRLVPKMNKWLNNYLKTYYNMDSQVGAGILLIAQKREMP